MHCRTTREILSPKQLNPHVAQGVRSRRSQALSPSIQELEEYSTFQNTIVSAASDNWRIARGCSILEKAIGILFAPSVQTGSTAAL